MRYCICFLCRVVLCSCVVCAACVLDLFIGSVLLSACLSNPGALFTSNSISCQRIQFSTFGSRHVDTTLCCRHFLNHVFLVCLVWQLIAHQRNRETYHQQSSGQINPIILCRCCVYYSLFMRIYLPARPWISFSLSFLSLPGLSRKMRLNCLAPEARK